MKGGNIFVALSLLSLFGGSFVFLISIQQMGNSNYTNAPSIPAGWLMGIALIILASVLTWVWTLYMVAMLCYQWRTKKKQWSVIKIITLGAVLVAALLFSITGVYLIYKYPLRLSECECTQRQWGSQCSPCTCGVEGTCDWGRFGSGRCICNDRYGGVDCNQCNDRYKPEPVGDLPACNICRTGYAGENCETCAKGYAGEDCSVCDSGWQPWTYTSALFPNELAADGRHLCDECLPNHFGYYCTRCPYGNDVPLKTLDFNDEIAPGQFVRTVDNKYGEIFQVQTLVGSTWTSVTYDPSDEDVLTTTRVQVALEPSGRLKWQLLNEITSIQCNNRGTCDDDSSKLNNTVKTNGKYEWEQTCTNTKQQFCSQHSDCIVSENCRGVCRGVDLPVDAVWFADYNGLVCENDGDCFGLTYAGRCQTKTCCDESYHGSGDCDCKPEYFGELIPGALTLQQFEMSPACDFCPGYDWITGKPNTICSGNKGTCQPSFARINEAGKGGEYLKMRCTCGEQVYIDPITKIVFPDKIIAWSGDLCECGDWDQDAKCDICSDGFWGPDCKTCPGGSGKNQCSRKGVCDAGVEGNGDCLCTVTEKNAWMLGPFQPRYPGEPEHKNAAGSSQTCTECSPMYWGDECRQCNGMAKSDGGGRFPLHLFEDIFQPAASVHLQVSSAVPVPICNRGYCYLACSRGGHCNWGRKGSGKCTCWSNQLTAEATWNPLDNVCMSTNRGTDMSISGVELCPSFGWCYDEDGETDSSRFTPDTCGSDDSEWDPVDREGLTFNRNVYIQDPNAWTPYDDWKSNNYQSDCDIGDCRKWQPISWIPDQSQRTCEASANRL
tara:strand:+ start:1662 stop:4160 length:2499 start_codon:yes stop_codon:yes gene_type:complete